MLGLLWVGIAVAGCDFDPWLLHPETDLLPLPPRVQATAACAAAAAFGIAALVAPRAFSGRRGRSLLAVGTTLALAALFAATPFARPAVHCAAAVATLAAAVLAAALALRPSGPSAARGRTAEVALAAVAILVVGLAGEAISSLTPRSHAVGYTLAARLWFERHWRPKNTLGYRDREHVDTAATKVFVLGDSFTSGLGVADPADRLSDRLQERLGNERRVYNLGVNGADTRAELARLAAHPFRPALVVLLYYVNDIEGAAEEVGHTIPSFRPYGDVPDPVAAVIRRSYLLDFAYWLLPHGDLARFEGTLEAMYRDAAVLARHLADLDRIVAHCRERSVDLVVVAFPHLARPVETAELLRPIVTHLRDADVPVIEVAPLVAGQEPRRFYVNRNDAHPNERLNALLTDAVAALVEPRLAARERRAP
jgi:lysophospholipase L1-like esterase